MATFMYVYHMCACCPRRSEEALRPLGTGITDSCAPSCGCWEQNPSPLEEGLGLFLLSQSLQPYT